VKTGESVSHYRVVELLGAGGMGEVYKAEDTRLKRPVALKFLPLALTLDRDAKNRLVHEAQAASALDHPNICTVYEIDETDDGRMFLAMAYYEGDTLKQRIAQGPLGVDEALDIISKVGRAVAAAHEAGIVHRDIKPANIMLTRRGEVKLLDFGVAKLAGQTELTRTGSTLGTLGYMAPEQITGAGFDARSDVWALGVVLYELLAGRLPFRGEHDVAVLRAIADTEPPPLDKVRNDVPPAVASIVTKALQKEPRNRYPSAAEFLRDVDALNPPSGSTGPMTTSAAPVRRRVVWPLAAALVAAVGVLGWFGYRYAVVRKARLRLPEIAALAEKERFSAAYRLLRDVEPVLAGDPELIKVQNGMVLAATITTDPPGADLYMKGYDEPDGAWMFLGRSPVETRAPFGSFRWRITKPGYETFEGSRDPALASVSFTLTPAGASPSGMVRVSGGTVQTQPSGSVTIPDFFIDRFEVTNREYKQFIDAGAYRTLELWQEPFVKDGRAVPWDEALAEFRDQTGRPGPATWELGTYAEGQDEFPVRGLSWYEAAAYARFAGKQLPTVHHWRLAAALGIYSDILEWSNFSGKGPARVGEYRGIGPYGTYDMAGNVKEWCWNSIGDHRYILGGGWNEPNYQFRGADARLPFDRSPNNGLRTIKVIDPSAVPAVAGDPVIRIGRDYSQEQPVSPEVFDAYQRLYAYDRTDLKPRVETATEEAAWRVERISYAAAYGDDRIVAYLFLPKTAPPYQTVVYFPHSGGFVLRSFEQAEMSYLGFSVKAGRALLFPMYKGMYERRIPPGTPSGPNAQRDLTIQQMKDLSRSVDYLDTRPDIAHDRVAYFGVSFGAQLAPVALAVEHRFRAAVVWSGGFPPGRRPPETDPLNFAPHVTTPILMLNGRDDFTFPPDTSQVPMFKMLGTRDADKQRVVYDGGHVFPFARIMKDTLDWLDRYLGAPR